MDVKELITAFTPIIVAIFVGIWGLMQQIQKAKSDKPRTDADATDKLIEAASKVIDQYQEMVEEFRKDKTNDMTRYNELQDKFGKLQKEMECVKETNENLKFEVINLREVIIRLARQMEEANLSPEVNLEELTKSRGEDV